MEAFPNGKYVDGPDALEGAWSVSVVETAVSRGTYVEEVERMGQESTDLGEIMGDPAYSSSDEW